MSQNFMFQKSVKAQFNQTQQTQKTNKFVNKSLVVHAKKPILTSSGNHTTKHSKQMSQISMFSQQSRAFDSIPIGPQKTKSQIQANQKQNLLIEEQEADLETINDDELLNMHAIENQEDSASTVSSAESKKKSVAEVFAERIAKWKAEKSKSIPLSDQAQFEDPQVLAEFG